MHHLFSRRPPVTKLAQMAGSHLFDGLRRGELEFLAHHLDEASVEAGRTLIQEGRRNHAFWVVVEGEVEVQSTGGRPWRIGPGGWFGSTSMLDGGPASATVVSRSPVRALVAGVDQFRALEGNPTVALRITDSALRRLRTHLVAGAS